MGQTLALTAVEPQVWPGCACMRVFVWRGEEGGLLTKAGSHSVDRTTLACFKRSALLICAREGVKVKKDALKSAYCTKYGRCRAWCACACVVFVHMYVYTCGVCVLEGGREGVGILSLPTDIAGWLAANVGSKNQLAGGQPTWPLGTADSEGAGGWGAGAP